jgi:hypothetical protein
LPLPFPPTGCASDPDVTVVMPPKEAAAAVDPKGNSMGLADESLAR